MYLCCLSWHFMALKRIRQLMLVPLCLCYSYRVLCCFLCIDKHMKSTCAQNQNKELPSEGTVHQKIRIQFLIYPLPCLWKVR